MYNAKIKFNGITDIKTAIKNDEEIRRIPNIYNS